MQFLPDEQFLADNLQVFLEFQDGETGLNLDQELSAAGANMHLLQRLGGEVGPFQGTPEAVLLQNLKLAMKLQ